MAKASKRRAVLAEKDIPMVALALATLRHEVNELGILQATKDVREVVEALKRTSHGIVQQGWLDAIRQGFSDEDL